YRAARPRLRPRADGSRLNHSGRGSRRPARRVPGAGPATRRAWRGGSAAAGLFSPHDPDAWAALAHGSRRGARAVRGRAFAWLNLAYRFALHVLALPLRALRGRTDADRFLGAVLPEGYVPLEPAEREAYPAFMGCINCG